LKWRLGSERTYNFLMANRARDWLWQAQRDLEHARSVAETYPEWGAFSAHQAAEKAVKALVMSMGGEPWGHSVFSLLSETGLPLPEEIAESARRLDKFYIPTRYPNGLPEGAPGEFYSPAEAADAVRFAEAIVAWCRDKMG